MYICITETTQVVDNGIILIKLCLIMCFHFYRWWSIRDFKVRIIVSVGSVSVAPKVNSRSIFFLHLQSAISIDNSTCTSWRHYASLISRKRRGRRAVGFLSRLPDDPRIYDLYSSLRGQLTAYYDRYYDGIYKWYALFENTAYILYRAYFQFEIRTILSQVPLSYFISRLHKEWRRHSIHLYVYKKIFVTF